MQNNVQEIEEIEEEYEEEGEYEVFFEQTIYTSVQVWATSQEEAEALVENWDTTKVDFSGTWERAHDAERPRVR